MNKYLEKIARIRRSDVALTAATTAIGAASGVLGHKPDGSKKTIKEKISGGLAGGTLGAIGGAAVAHGNQKSKLFMNRTLRNNRKLAPGNAMVYERYRAAYPHQATVGKHHSPLHKFELEAKSFKTKAQFDTHFKRTLHKHHPDKGGNQEQFKRLSVARDKIQKSDWYKKLR